MYTGDATTSSQDHNPHFFAIYPSSPNPIQPICHQNMFEKAIASKTTYISNKRRLQHKTMHKATHRIAANSIQLQSAQERQRMLVGARLLKVHHFGEIDVEVVGDVC